MCGLVNNDRVVERYHAKTPRRQDAKENLATNTREMNTVK